MQFFKKSKNALVKTAIEFHIDYMHLSLCLNARLFLPVITGDFITSIYLHKSSKYY